MSVADEPFPVSRFLDSCNHHFSGLFTGPGLDEIPLIPVQVLEHNHGSV
jgi:hypothetical protein